MLSRFLPSAQAALLAQFLRFAVVGGLCFVVDTSVVYTLRGGLGLYRAGLVSYLVAASVNWVLSRHWTFKGHGTRQARAHRQWALFLATGLIGFALNRGTYVALIAYVPLCAALPVLPVAAGAVAGMFVNFATARALVFR